MGRIFLRLLLVGGLAQVLMGSETSEARERHDRRQSTQRARVHEGRESGELTRAEARRARQSGAVIRRAERRAQADGQESENEAQRLERLQDRRSRQIHRLKHNDHQQTDSTRSDGAPAEAATESADSAQ